MTTPSVTYFKFIQLQTTPGALHTRQANATGASIANVALVHFSERIPAPTRKTGYAYSLSRLPQTHQCQNDPSPTEDIMLLDILPESPVHADNVAEYSTKYAIFSKVLKWVWQRYAQSSESTPFASRQHELSAHKRYLLLADHVTIPLKLLFRVLEALHVRYLGIIRMKVLACSYIWWPGMDAATEECVRRCLPCQETQPKMPLPPVQPWETTGTLCVQLHIATALVHSKGGP